MQEATQNIALIYFSRRPDQESRHKSWFPGKPAGRDRAIASSLILQSSKIIRQSGFPVFYYHEGNQRGATFGERLANAYEEVFNFGYEAAIAVGNDSPEIAGIDWQSVSKQLCSGKCVLGPSLRGGAYLIGITAGAFDKQALQELPWQTNKLFDALTRFCTHTDHQPHVLHILRDINSYYDLQKLVKTSPLAPLFKNLIRWLLSLNKKSYQAPSPELKQAPLLLNTPLRGPPQSSLCFNNF